MNRPGTPVTASKAVSLAQFCIKIAANRTGSWVAPREYIISRPFVDGSFFIVQANYIRVV